MPGPKLPYVAVDADTILGALAKCCCFAGFVVRLSDHDLAIACMYAKLA